MYYHDNVIGMLRMLLPYFKVHLKCVVLKYHNTFICFLLIPLLKFTIIKFLDVNFQILLPVSIVFATLTGNKTTHYQPGLLRAYFTDCCVVSTQSPGIISATTRAWICAVHAMETTYALNKQLCSEQNGSFSI